MSHRPNTAFAERAYLEGVPIGYLRLQLKNWGLPPGASLQLAEEAAAEAYARSLRQSQFANYVHYQRWVNLTAKNWCIDQLRRRKPLAALRDGPHWVSVAESFEEELPLLGRYLEFLTPDEREILRLTYEERLTLDEIVSRMERGGEGTPNARRLRIFRSRNVAIEKLQRYFGIKETTG